ncbi:MAG: phosphatase PAP2 family protein [Alphaproteobacteria bacterium]|nr:phosphatase PAP2 family protein [Alphaproteobacteria bacterium]
MQAILNRILFVMAAAVVTLDAAWILAGHFAIDAGNYALLAVLVVPLMGAAAYYGKVRRDDGLNALLACGVFMIVIPAACALLSYLLVTVAGTRMDAQLAAIDRAIGFDWVEVMTVASNHPSANAVLALAYTSVMPQTFVLMMVLGLTRRGPELYRLSLALAIGALLTLCLWTIAPSFGAFSVVTLPDAVSRKLGLVLGFDYGRSLVAMLKDGPGFISPTELRGIVGFPSYHTLQALVLAWYARSIPWLRWPAFALNAVVLASIPIQGGHHLVDMFGGAAVTAAAVALAAWIVRTAANRAARNAALPVEAPLAPEALPAR